MALNAPLVKYAGALTADEILAEMVSDLMAALALMERNPKETHIVVRKIRLKLDIVDLKLALLRKIQKGHMEPELEEQLNMFDINLALLKMQSAERMEQLQQMTMRDRERGRQPQAKSTEPQVQAVIDTQDSETCKLLTHDLLVNLVVAGVIAVGWCAIMVGLYA